MKRIRSCPDITATERENVVKLIDGEHLIGMEQRLAALGQTIQHGHFFNTDSRMLIAFLPRMGTGK